MKKIILTGSFCLFALSAFGQRPALAVLPAPAAEQPQTEAAVQPSVSFAQQQKAWKVQRKQIQKLVKAYHKAAPQEQAAIRTQLEQLVAQGTQEGLALLKAQIAVERANLDAWAQKVAQDENNLPHVTAQRVDELLSKDAKKKHKARRKAWKKQLREARKKMR